MSESLVRSSRRTESISLLTSELASSQDKKERCTLVVAPLALLEQWKDEIESKCRTNHFKCLIVSCPLSHRSRS